MSVSENMRAEAARAIAALKDDDNDFRALHAYGKARRAAKYAASEASHDLIVAAAEKHGWTVEPPGPELLPERGVDSSAAYRWTFRRGRTVLQWWPGRGRTMIDYRTKGPTCTAKQIVTLLGKR